MLIQSVVTTLRGSRKAVVEVVTGLHRRANELMDTDLSLFAGGAGYPAGTFVFSTMVENMTAAMTMNNRIYSDEKFSSIQEDAAEFWTSPADTRIRQIVAMAPEIPPEIGVGAIVSNFTAEISTDRFAQAMEFGAEITAYVHNGAAVPIAFARSITGSVGEASWIGLYPDAAALDKGLEWEATDVGYAERYAAAGGLFMSGSAHRGLLTRIA